MSDYLSDNLIQKLRSSNTITSNEVVMKVGDLYVVENVIEGTKRTLDSSFVKNLQSSTISEGRPEQKLLKD